MPGVVATLKANLRTKLALVSGLTQIPANVSIEEPPDTDKVYFAVSSVHSGTRLADEHGGATLVGYDGVTLVVQLATLQDVSIQSVGDTIADFEESVNGVCHKSSNWTAGVSLVVRSGGEDRSTDTLFRNDFYYTVRYRVAQNLS